MGVVTQSDRERHADCRLEKGRCGDSPWGLLHGSRDGQIWTRMKAGLEGDRRKAGWEVGAVKMSLHNLF